MTNPDGTISIVQVDPNNPVITLPDGTTAHVSIKLVNLKKTCKYKHMEVLFAP